MKILNSRYFTFLLLILLVFPFVIFGKTDIDFVLDTWTQEVEQLAIDRGLIPTGLRIRQASYGPWNRQFGFGLKTFLDNGLGKAKDEYKKFEGNYFFCVGGHGDAQPVLTLSQMFSDQRYNVKKFPQADIMIPDKNLAGKTSEEKDNIRKFNFLMITFTSAMFGDRTVEICEDPIKTTAQFAVAATMNWAASDHTLYRGVSLEDDWNSYKAVYYDLIINEFATNKPSPIPHNEIINFAKVWFTEIWNTAKSAMSMDVNIETEETILKAKIIEKDEQYYAVIPYPGFAVDSSGAITATTGATESICANWSMVKARNLAGDWVFDGAYDNAIWFKSPSGELADVNFATIYWESNGSDMTMTGKDFTTWMNVAAAKLYTFRGATPNGNSYVFDRTQIFFAADFSTQKDIIVKIDHDGEPWDIVNVNRYRHNETFFSHYNVNLIKADSETGKPLSGAHFDILEREDLENQSAYINSALDQEVTGSIQGKGNPIVTEWTEEDSHDEVDENYTGYNDYELTASEPNLYNWGNDTGSQFTKWDDPYNDPCPDDAHVTGGDGFLYYKQTMNDSASGDLAHYDTKSYAYTKGFCGGHPAPYIEYVEIPAEETDEEGEVTNQDEIDHAIQRNKDAHKEAWKKWNEKVEECERLAAEGGFFHSIKAGIAQEALEKDRDEFYKNFISITYDYSALETRARSGYTLHGIHSDDIPVEWRTVTSSEYKDFMGNHGEEIEHAGGSGGEGTVLYNNELSDLPKVNQSESSDKITPLIKLEESYADTIQIQNNKNDKKTISKEKFRLISTPSEPIPSVAATPENADKNYEDILKGIKTNISDHGLTKNRHEKEKDDSESESRSGHLRDTVNLKSIANYIVSNAGDILDWTFIVYDHRTEGEVHFNKRDLNLAEKQGEQYSSYTESNGDGTLEGAVYGLFAAEDILHPDSDSDQNSDRDTGFVYKKDNLLSVTTTDRNGNASFMAITEVPGYTYDYKAGAIVKTDDGWADSAPKNLYTNQSEADKRQDDNEKFKGSSDYNHDLSLTDSSYGDGTYYQKHSSNQGVDGTGDSSLFYPIGNNEDNNGNCWIGRPLFAEPDGTKYYIRELSRSEGYELSVYGKDDDRTNRRAELANGGPVSIGTAQSTNITYDLNKTYNSFTIASQGTASGYEVTAMNIPDTAKFYVTSSKMIYNPDVIHTELVPRQEKQSASAGSYVLINGKRTEAKTGDSKTLPNGERVIVKEVSKPAEVLISIKPQNNLTYEFPELTADSADTEEFKEQINKLFARASLKSPSEGAPWMEVELNGSTPEEWAKNIEKALKDQYRVFNRFEVVDIIHSGGPDYAVITYSYEEFNTIPSCLCDPATSKLYVKYYTDYLSSGNKIPGFLYQSIDLADLKNIKTNDSGFVISATMTKQILGEMGLEYLADDLSNLTFHKTYSKTYWVYGEGEYQRDSQGNVMETTVYEEQEVKGVWEEQVVDVPVGAEQTGYQYEFQLTPDMIGDDGITNMKITYEKSKEDTTGYPSVFYAADYGVISVSTPYETQETYILPITLRYENARKVYSDGGTRVTPAQVLERPIRQQVKIIKDIQTDLNGDYENNTYGEVMETEPVNKLDNFRFKAYLKSNLERLYRDEDGTVTWLDGNGNPLTPYFQDKNADGNYDSFNWMDQNGNIIDFPEVSKTSNEDGTGNGTLISTNVQKLYTKVPHKNSDATSDIANNVANHAITANQSLYSYEGKNTNVSENVKIKDDQNPGHTRLLETGTATIENKDGSTKEVNAYNYEKFFDAIDAANRDKWDDDMHSTFTGTTMRNYPGQHWLETYYETYQKDDADPDHTIENTDGMDSDHTAGGDRDKSFKPFAFITEHRFKNNGQEQDYYHGTANNDYLENQINTSDYARANAEASDAARQFAIDWYLKDEASKMLTNNGKQDDQAMDGEIKYSDALYDHALFHALMKTYNYLKPFYTFDLDTMYAVLWDSAENGGSDHDYATLSADTLYDKNGTSYYYGVSSYLPYGVYVIREEQPYRDDLDDFANKHYKIDVPKEIMVPSVYEQQEKQTDPAQYHSFYYYNPSDTPEQLQEKYHIRFNEEWPDNHTDDLRNYIIRAHNHSGDYEIYKYGLDTDKMTRAEINYPGSSYTSDGFTITQDEYDPLKNYYNSPLVNIPEEGGNAGSHYLADDKNTGNSTANGGIYEENGIEKIYHYGSISENKGEEDGAITMTGVHTAYEGRYAPMLVPWSVTEPEESDRYHPSDFTGYSDRRFRNVFYVAKLRIEKIDTDTGENILHSSAIFGIYAAGRYQTREEVEKAAASGIYGTDINDYPEIGDVKLYTEDTAISGSREFLMAMKATDIRYTERGNKRGQHSGIVKAGTPVCREKDQIILSDRDIIEQPADPDKRSGTYQAYATLNNLPMTGEEGEGRAYADQNTGYVITPRPLGAGTYVIAEIEPPAGYIRSDPVAVEIYSDSIKYYKDGNRFSKVTAEIYR